MCWCSVTTRPHLRLPSPLKWSVGGAARGRGARRAVLPHGRGAAPRVALQGAQQPRAGVTHCMSLEIVSYTALGKHGCFNCAPSQALPCNTPEFLSCLCPRQLLHRRGDHDGAEAHYRRALSIFPKCAPSAERLCARAVVHLPSAGTTVILVSSTVHVRCVLSPSTSSSHMTRRYHLALFNLGTLLHTTAGSGRLPLPQRPGYTPPPPPAEGNGGTVSAGESTGGDAAGGDRGGTGGGNHVGGATATSGGAAAEAAALYRASVAANPTALPEAHYNLATLLLSLKVPTTSTPEREREREIQREGNNECSASLGGLLLSELTCSIALACANSLVFARLFLPFVCLLPCACDGSGRHPGPRGGRCAGGGPGAPRGKPASAAGAPARKGHAWPRQGYAAAPR